MIRYGARWPNDNPLLIELYCIRAGGRFPDPSGSGRMCGRGLEFHIREAQKLLWPEKEHHRWSDLILHHFAQLGTRDPETKERKRVLGILGPASSGKTHCVGTDGLVMYFASPDDTTVIATSTTRDQLELRIWGEIKKWWTAAKRLWGDIIPGTVLVGQQALVTHASDEARDIRNGVICIPCGPTVDRDGTKGLSAYIGIKNKNVFILGDEVQFMGPAFKAAFSNLSKNQNFRGVLMGNPSNPDDPLSTMTEPENGWDSIIQDGVTKTWRTKFYSGTAIQLIGTDSPNFDYDQSEGKRYPYLIGEEDIKADIDYYGADSALVASQNIGTLPTELGDKRVITSKLCAQFQVTEKVQWGPGEITTVAGLDTAYTGEGDRNVLIILGFGYDIHENLMISLMRPPILISSKGPSIVEDNISNDVMEKCKQFDIAPDDLFYDATGRGTLGSSLSRIWSPYVNPLDFGASATNRPAIWGRNSVVCKDKFANFVTELWFAARAVIESNQLRGFTNDLIVEGSARKWEEILGRKVKVEQKKETKKRLGRSPDLFDAFVSALEGARRKGFTIKRVDAETDNRSFEERIAKLRERFGGGATLKSKTLKRIA